MLHGEESLTSSRSFVAYVAAVFGHLKTQQMSQMSLLTDTIHHSRRSKIPSKPTMHFMSSGLMVILRARTAARCVW
jgi:hypothetical protein